MKSSGIRVADPTPSSTANKTAIKYMIDLCPNSPTPKRLITSHLKNNKANFKFGIYGHGADKSYQSLYVDEVHFGRKCKKLLIENLGYDCAKLEEQKIAEIRKATEGRKILLYLDDIWAEEHAKKSACWTVIRRQLFWCRQVSEASVVPRRGF